MGLRQSSVKNEVEDEQLKAREGQIKKEEEELQNKEDNCSRDEEQKRVEAEKEKRMQDYQHEEEMKKIEDLEKSNQRKDTLSEKAMELEHARLMHGQEQLFLILKDTFSKVRVANMNEAAYSAVVLQSIQAGKSVDKEVLKAVQSKIPDVAPPSIDFGNITETGDSNIEIEDGRNDEMAPSPLLGNDD